MGETQPIGSTWTDRISENIARYSKERNVTMQVIQEDAGIPRTTFFRKLRHPGSFSARELGDIAAILGVTVNDLVRAA